MHQAEDDGIATATQSWTRLPVRPLALNQVDMRMPHDGDWGRDREKRGLGAWLI
jgi:hypothetical protein